MVEKILKENYVNPKVEMTLDDYNRLVSLARMNAKKIEKRAREIYDKEGVVKIEFDGRFITKRYGEREADNYVFDVTCREYNILPTGEYEKTLFTIPQEMRQRIADKTKRYVEEVFEGKFGEHMSSINAIRDLEKKTERERFKFAVWTIAGWLLASLMLCATMFK